MITSFSTSRAKSFTSALLFFAAIGGGSASAQLVAWNVSGIKADTNPTLQATSLAENVAPGLLSLGGGISPSATANTFGGSDFDQTSLAASLADGDYLSFAFEPTNGYAIDVTSISLNFGLGSTIGFNIALFSDANGSYEAENVLWTHSFSGTTTPPSQTISLSEFSNLQGLNTETTFRLYGWRTTEGSATFRIRDLTGNDLAIYGSTHVAAVPEPSTYALTGGLIALAVAVTYRRKQRGRT